MKIHEHRADAGAGEQVVHVIVGARQVEHLRLQLGVDRGQFLVDRLQLLLGSLQFLVGGLQLFVDRLHFFAGRLELFSGALQLLDRALEGFLLGEQLRPERDQTRINVHPGGGRLARAHGCRITDRPALRHLFQNDEKERRLG